MPPRKRFQIHLSTAIVMMVVAGAMIWANVRNSYVAIKYGHGPFQYSSEAMREKIADFGWPVQAIACVKEWSANESPSTSRHLCFTTYEVVVFDLAIALLIILCAAFLCEWLIRRRAARKGA